ncbi:MAG: FIST C-terminal domain-containing protein [Polyangiaceae bacterium]|nr:FIST C-terminal domain-containing protein [Polyangiaceae bacterium]MCW5791245.1 FIST C-terminal domain-containing protein [Polyangiaceae bacterium]
MRAGRFTVRSRAPAKIAEALADASARVLRKPGEGAALVFVTGPLRETLPEIAAAIAQVGCPVPVLIAGGGGVLDPDQEILVGEAAAVGLVWDAGRAEALPLDIGVDPDDEEAAREAILRALADRTGRGEPTALLFCRGEEPPEEALDALAEARVTPFLFGGGTSGPHGSAVVMPGSEPVIAANALLIIRGLRPPELRCSPACRLLTPLYAVTEHQGPWVFELDGRPALEVLREAKPSDEELIFTVVAPELGAPTHGGRPELLLRKIEGVAPARGGVLLSVTPPPGSRIALAMRSASAARADLEAIARELLRDTRGSAPCFGVYLMSSMSRGVNLHREGSVDVRILRQRFPNMPWIGLGTAFELGPYAGRPAFHSHTGVLALFTSPS